MTDRQQDLVLGGLYVVRTESGHAVMRYMGPWGRGPCLEVQSLFGRMSSSVGREDILRRAGAADLSWLRAHVNATKDSALTRGYAEACKIAIREIGATASGAVPVQEVAFGSPDAAERTSDAHPARVGDVLALSHARCCGEPAEVIRADRHGFTMRCTCGSSLCAMHHDGYLILRPAPADPLPPDPS